MNNTAQGEATEGNTTDGALLGIRGPKHFMRLYIGLLHYPVYDKHRRVIASAVTTVDLHDIARAARTYDVSRFFVITPLSNQQKLARRVVRHWTEGYGAGYNPDRKAALQKVCVVSSLERAEAVIAEAEGEPPLVMATDAAPVGLRTVTYGEARGMVAEGRVLMLLLGTAWGLDRKVLARAHLVLPPIAGATDYNHLSVRSAAAIVLDRLVGSYV